MVTGEKYNYLECINVDKKNQTAILLEKFFNNVKGNKEYVSVVPDEDEKYRNLPTMEEVNEQADRVVKYATAFVVGIDDIEIFDEDVFRKYLCNLNFLIDKLLAVNIADVLNQKEMFDNQKDFGELLINSVMESKLNWDKENASDTQVTQDLLEIDTSKLSIGMTVKNYKVLCELLGQDIKTGNARKAQLDVFKCYFDWERSGQKFIITDIYDTPLTKEDKRKLGNNSIYVQYIEVVLLQYLSRQEGYTRTLTKRNWWEMLGIVNHKYGRTSENQLKNLDFTVTQWEVRHFYQRCNKKLEQILFSALNSLKNRKLITYEVQTIIVEHDNGREEHYFEANDYQKKQILEIERYVLHNIMGYEKMFQVFIRFQQDIFYQKVNELLYKHYGWDHYFKQIKIIYAPESVREALPELEIKLQRELLNNKVVDYLNANAKEIYEKNKTEYQQQFKNLIDGRSETFRIETKKKEAWNPPDTYLTAQSILTEELIRIGHKDMTFSAEDFLKSNADLDDLFQFDK